MSLSALLPSLLDLVGKLFPDPEEKAEAQRKLIELQQAGEFRELDKAFEAIKAEAGSADPWTSRARPSFLYVVYVMILSAIPAGLLYIVNPVAAANLIVGMQMWLNAIPSDMWVLFGVGYTGYTGARTIEKSRGVAK